MSGHITEQTRLLPVSNIQVATRKRCCKVNTCLRSKAGLVVLLWSFPVLQLIYTIVNINNVFKSGSAYYALTYTALGVSLVAVFAPMAGLLTDLRYSRYKTVLCSSYVVLIESMVILIVLIVCGGIYAANKKYFSNHLLHKALTLTLIFVTVPILGSATVFIINSIRFGLDQLHDSPTEDSILFVHWYVWIYYVCSLITGLIWEMYNYYCNRKIAISGYSMTVVVLVLVISLLIFSLCVSKLKKAQFLIEPIGNNPYKLVFLVVKFAYQHKVPLRRSAFTYCEDDLPSRMDFGKKKYGGPFTTKEVEDVKAFWGILKVVSCIGPVFMLQVAAEAILPFFAKPSNIFIQNITVDNVSYNLHTVCIKGFARKLLINNGLLSPENVNCLFSGFTHLKDVGNTSKIPLYQNPYFFVSHHFLSAITDMLIDVAVLEFISSQSPYSMKGLLLGYYFSTKSLFQAIAISTIVPFAVLELLLFSYVSKKYKYRKVDEPSNEYRYAENYYSNIPH